jgi:hypothetical protein
VTIPLRFPAASNAAALITCDAFTATGPVYTVPVVAVGSAGTVVPLPIV